MSKIMYPVFTVVVFQGSPSSEHLTEAYRRTFETEADARRYARLTVCTTRIGATEGHRYQPPCASVFEDSPSRGLGRHVAEYTSAARRRWLRQIAEASRAA